MTPATPSPISPRDLAIAEAIRSAAYTVATDRCDSVIAIGIRELDVATIIAKVAP